MKTCKNCGQSKEQCPKTLDSQIVERCFNHKFKEGSNGLATNR